MPPIVQMPKKVVKEEKMSFVDLVVPLFLEQDSTGEIVVNLKNTTNKELKNISVDFSDLEEFFTINGSVEVKSLRPGMQLKNSVRIKSKFQEGTFPIKIKITGSGATIEKEYTIKVGGTEIY